MLRYMGNVDTGMEWIAFQWKKENVGAVLLFHPGKGV